MDTFFRRTLRRQVAHKANALHHLASIVTQCHPGHLHGAVAPLRTAQSQCAFPKAIVLPRCLHLWHQRGTRLQDEQIAGTSPQPIGSGATP